MQHKMINYMIQFQSFAFYFKLFVLILKHFLGQIRDKVIRDFMAEFSGDPDLRKEVLSSLPVKVESTLNHHRSKQIGHLPGDRDSFEPRNILSTVQNGSKIITLDSKDLPQDWHKIELGDFLPPENNPEGDVFSADIATSEDDLALSEVDSLGGPLSSVGSGADSPPPLNDSINDGDICNVTNGLFSETLDLTRVQTVPRVLVFTTLSLLGLFAVSSKGSVDGTFSCMTRLWTQLFVLLCEYRGSWIPVAMGWLPDKESLPKLISF